MIANLMKFYEGGLTYRDCMSMSFQELLRWNRYAMRINSEIENG